MEKRPINNIHPLLPGLANLGLDFRFADRKPMPTEEMDDRAAWIRREIAIHTARP